MVRDMTTVPVLNFGLNGMDIESSKEGVTRDPNRALFGVELDEMKKNRTWLKWFKLWFYKNLNIADWGERQPGLKENTSIGYYGLKTHIFSYDPHKIRGILSMCLARDLTVCNHASLFFFHIGVALYAVILMSILAGSAYHENEYGVGPACTSPPSVNKDVCAVEGILNTATDDFRFLIGFILAGYVGGVISMWGKRRTNYASLCGNARNTVLTISSLLPDDKNDKEMMNVRYNMCRWTMLGYELAMMKARGVMDDESARCFLEERGYLLSKEWECMCEGDRHTTAFYWVLTQARRLEEKGKLRTDYVILISSAISNIRGQANDLMSSLDRDTPFPYVALCGFLVKMNIFIFTTWKAFEWSQWLFGMGHEMFHQSKFWIDLFCMVVWNLSYGGLYDLGYALYNPFGARRIDVAHEAIGGGIFKLAKSLAEGGKIPPLMTK